MTPPDSSPLADMARDLRRHLEIELALGAPALPFSEERAAEFARRRAEAAVRSRADAPPVAAPVPSAAPLSTAGKVAALDALRREMLECHGCELGRTRRNLVFGDGNPDADLMFIGEAPGETEDEQGLPFVGKAGQLLTRIIEAIGLQRGQVYIGNILKCRPPGNRAPLPNEAAVCSPYLVRQIEIIRPRLIVTLGNPATQTLLQTREGITRMRGKFTTWRGIEVMPTFHPSYLLRNPPAKREVWADMQKVHARMVELGLAIGALKRGNTR